MPINYEVDKWLQNEGRYEYHCFISWPHTINPDVTECARAIKKAIEENLAFSFDRPKVFLDESDLKGGDIWKPTLKHALCRSICMVAISVPMYYRPEHVWCGLEWAAMADLASRRLREKHFNAIIPLMVRKCEPLPEAASAIQYIDFSKLTVMRRRFYRDQEFTLKVQQIVSRIEQVAEELWASKARADCDQYSFPEKSAFHNYGGAASRHPLMD